LWRKAAEEPSSREMAQKITAPLQIILTVSTLIDLDLVLDHPSPGENPEDPRPIGPLDVPDGPRCRLSNVRTGTGAVANDPL